MDIKLNVCSCDSRGPDQGVEVQEQGPVGLVCLVSRAHDQQLPLPAGVLRVPSVVEIQISSAAS